MKMKKPAALLTAFAAALNVGCSVYGPPPDEPVSDVDGDNTVILSGSTGEGIDRLLTLIEQTIHKSKKEYTLLIPYSSQSVLSTLYDNYTVSNVEYIDDGISVSVVLDERGKGQFARYVTLD